MLSGTNWKLQTQTCFTSIAKHYVLFWNFYFKTDNKAIGNTADSMTTAESMTTVVLARNELTDVWQTDRSRQSTFTSQCRLHNTGHQHHISLTATTFYAVGNTVVCGSLRGQNTDTADNREEGIKVMNILPSSVSFTILVELPDHGSISRKVAEILQSQFMPNWYAACHYKDNSISL